ncbi:MAG: hypothetical protein R3Y11_02515 [Pseudomonadota bacterium]
MKAVHGIRLALYLSIVSIYLFAHAPVMANQDAFQWKITFQDIQITTSLDSVSTFIEYGGDTTKIENFNEAHNGNVYLLVNINLEKSRVGGKGFDWKDAYLIDEQGNRFHRMTNDTFLSTHGYKRMQSTKIMISNEGYIAFELPDSAVNKNFFFIHESAEGVNKVVLKK